MEKHSTIAFQDSGAVWNRMNDHPPSNRHGFTLLTLPYSSNIIFLSLIACVAQRRTKKKKAGAEKVPHRAISSTIFVAGFS